MGVDFLLILCLQDKDDLYWDEVVRILAMRQDKLRGCIHRNLGGVLDRTEVSIRPGTREMR